jgi:hypothetical protein
MDQNIYFTNNEFDFSHISITQPVSVQGGAYFTKIRFNGEPLYIQPSKCSTKQGLSETNKKAYIDLMFTNEDEEVIEWFEHLEERLINLIFEKREIWFQNEMEKEDIENFFNPICRAFKGGKFHLIRVNIPKNKTVSTQYNCNVYDENENVVSIQDLNDSHSIIPCVEVQGIKFSARNFQLELVGKQFLLLNNKPIFNSCVIKRDTNKTKSMNMETVSENKVETVDVDVTVTAEHNVTPHVDNVTPIENNTDTVKEIQTPSIIQTTNMSDVKGLHKNIISALVDDDDIDEDNQDDKHQDKHQDTRQDKHQDTRQDKHLEKHEIVDNNIAATKSTENVPQPINVKHLEESEPISREMTLEDITNHLNITNKATITLKRPNEVYYEIYKIAKDKAKQHKKAAITHYLEAKQIKNTYHLEDLDDSDTSSILDDSYDSDASDDSESDEIKNQINEIVEEVI